MGLDSLTTLAVTRTGPAVRVLIDHGEINMMDAAMMGDLWRLVNWLRSPAGRDIRVVVLESANPDFFIAHVDLALLAASVDDPEAAVGSFQDLAGAFRALDQVTVGVVAGRVAGGGMELLVNLDLRFAVTGRAVFNQIETGIGVIPAGSGPQHLLRLLGRGRALEVILAHDDLDAGLAERYGLVNRALAPDAVAPFLDRLVTRIATVPLADIADIKTTLAAPDVAAGLAAERSAFASVLGRGAALPKMRRFLAAGGQTPAGERRLADLVADLDRTEPG
ncbi:enoyl-CoA hydratase/isomerase family protein [Mycolicibacter hiberniae]|uniref:Putative enoyl-CoA hydratase n=1 Tax=Mycolicibacter hiberniae TaxID=29314 RepID=A0A7I7X700_9MYCO|nr:enoyl-CoA hydratase/isomerase family protein [Mycolicibacter hiberniae]MCV7087485.1 enoyl-CoA hydratase/isomerase family protein [Mycolicibacter hiberniae]ORV69057.1 enoyl-CoA hydratase [Mycolicibacter hiberniae]BBZ24995.1 putative enoyl-CoA hydratase [Mycolicibacter hiberniae]